MKRAVMQRGLVRIDRYNIAISRVADRLRVPAGVEPRANSSERSVRIRALHAVVDDDESN